VAGKNKDVDGYRDFRGQAFEILFWSSKMNNQNKKIEVKNLFHVFSSPKWIALIFILPLLAAAHFASAETTGPAGSAKFDHFKTGFNLTGAHILARCESCHIQGQFRGTPRDCATCHMAGNRLGATAKPNQHVPTTGAPCDSCHRTTGWIPASYSHAGVAPGACMTCHNGSMSTGKPRGHTLTTESCDKCHRTTAWVPAGYNHLGVVPGTCTTCHNGTTATGVPNGHLGGVNPGQCDGCHRTTAWLPTSFNHTGVVPGTCTNCHNGTTATGKPSGHVATTDSCDKCHTTTTWLGASFNHAGVVAGTCATCHNGTTAKGVGGGNPSRYPLNSGQHVSTNLWPYCDSCHKSTTSFTGASVHKSVTVPKGSCTSCHYRSSHEGSGSQSCDNCHTSTSNWGSGV